MLLTISSWVARMPFFQRSSIIKSTVTDPSSIGSRSNARMQPSSLNVSTHEVFASRQSLIMEWASCFVVTGYNSGSITFRSSLRSLLRYLGRIQLPWLQDIEKVTYPKAYGIMPRLFLIGLWCLRQKMYLLKIKFIWSSYWHWSIEKYGRNQI